MKVIGTVCGSAEQAKPLVIGTDTVYVHTNIEQATDPETGQPMEGQFNYHEVQYDKDEYLEILTKRITTVNTDTDAMMVDHEYRLTVLELGV